MFPKSRGGFTNFNDLDITDALKPYLMFYKDKYVLCNILNSTFLVNTSLVKETDL
jgi:hypothetical protein